MSVQKTPTPPNIWGGGGFEAYYVAEREERPDPRLPWHVMVNGVGSWPVAWFYEGVDAKLWAKTMNAHFASGTLTEGGDAKQAPGESLSGATRQGDAHA